MTRHLRLFAVLALSIALLVVPTASAEAKGSKLDTAKANAKQIKQELANVTKRLQQEEAKNQSARQASAAANQRLRNARAEEAAIETRLDQLRVSLRDIALQSYMHSDSARSRMTIGDDPATVSRAQYLRDVALGSNIDAQDAYRAAQEDKELAVRNAEAAARVAGQRQRAVSDTVNALRASRARQLELAGAAEARVNAALKESEALRRLGARGSRGSTSRRGSISLTTVRGITVATQIAGNLERMLDAAEADGKRFGGSGYRSSDGQIAARRRNCGTSDYAVYDMPSSRCRPPTARPGQSLHEQGLAIDFTYNGSIIQSRSSEGFRWLKANAARYGFYNLPSEAWHWSVNGN